MPQRLNESHVQLEKHLESWIEANPALLEIGLKILGRQVLTVAGRIDLLGRDPQGTWTIVEVKRGQTTRDALAQAIDYAAAISELSQEELAQTLASYPAKAAVETTPATQLEDSPGDRAIRIILTGVGADPGLQRVVNFLEKRHNCRFPSWHSLCSKLREVGRSWSVR
jgi:Holliday junction resolvase-like predicted endonuclease